MLLRVALICNLTSATEKFVYIDYDNDKGNDSDKDDDNRTQLDISCSHLYGWWQF